MKPDLHELAAAYVLDALDDDERREFEEHYPTCETCSAEVAELREASALLATSTSKEPPASLKDRVMAEVATTRQASPAVAPVTPVTQLAERRHLRRSPSTLLAAAAAVLLAVVGAVVFVGTRGGSELDDIVAAPDAIVTPLEGATGDFRLVWSPDRDQVALFGDGLPEPGEGQVYALWALTEGATVALPAGLFDGEGGTVRTALDVADVDSDGWGITIEPAGGSLQPTGEILYAATY